MHHSTTKYSTNPATRELPWLLLKPTHAQVARSRARCHLLADRSWCQGEGVWCNRTGVTAAGSCFFLPSVLSPSSLSLPLMLTAVFARLVCFNSRSSAHTRAGCYTYSHTGRLLPLPPIAAAADAVLLLMRNAIVGRSRCSCRRYCGCCSCSRVSMLPAPDGCHVALPSRLPRYCR